MSEIVWAIPLIFFGCSMIMWCICCCVCTGCKPPVDAPLTTVDAAVTPVTTHCVLPNLPNDEDPV
jgi:hypothetical protein